MGNAQAKLENQLFEMRMTAKQMGRLSIKCEKQEKEERAKVKKAMEKGNMDGARIYAQNAIRKKSESSNALKLQSRIDAVAGRLETALRANQMTKSMTKIVSSMESILKSMNMESVSETMRKFEQQFENLDVTSEAVNDAMSSQMTLSTPEDDVNSLLTEVAEEHSIALKHDMGQLTVDNKEVREEVSLDALNERLSKLKE